MANNFVTATCPNCNSPLQIKEGQDFVKCEYCGTISSAPKAIEYHQHQSTNYNFSGANPVVNFSNGQDLETLVKNADMHLKLKNYADAQSIYEKISKEYPHDYRGWWGLILVNSQELTDTVFYVEETNFTDNLECFDKPCLNETFHNISFAWKNVKETAPAKITAELTAKFQPYYDIGYTAYEKAVYADSISEFQARIADKKESIQSSSKAIKDANDRIKRCRSDIWKDTSLVVGRAFLGIVFCALSVFLIEKAITLLFSAAIFFGICLGAIAVPCAIYCLKQRSEIKSLRYSIKLDEKNIAHDQLVISENEKKIAKLNDGIKKCESDIKEAQSNLANAEKKLAELTRKA